MSYQALHDEIVNDPELRGYASMSNQEIADDMHEKRYNRNRDTVSGGELLNGMDMDEYVALTGEKKSQWLAFCSQASVAANTTGLRIVRDIFGDSSQTETNLMALRQETVDRIEMLGISVSVTAGTIEYVKVHIS